MPKKNATAALTRYDERLAEIAKRATKAESTAGAGGSFISLKSGQMSYQGGAVPGNKMKVIVLASIIENAFRPGDYDPDNPQPPTCYAFGEDANDMHPHEEVEEPVNENCSDCENHQFGSAERGKGMACSVNRRRLALLIEGELNNLAGAKEAYMSLSYFSSKEWKGYVDQLDALYNKPPFAFVTEISVVPDAKAQFLVKFQMLEEIEGEDLGILLDRYDKALKSIAFPYQKLVEIEPAPRPQVKGVRAPAPGKKPKY
jgi:hypothetical protein